MPSVVWIHCASDPLQSGELRRLALPALAIEGGAWRSRFCRADQLAGVEADIAVLPLRALEALPAVVATGARSVVVEIDEEAAGEAESLRVLGALSGRIAAVAARGAAARLAARGAVGPATPIWLIPDPAETLAELKAAAIRYGQPLGGDARTGMAAGGELWFAEEGDGVDAEEVEHLAARWREPADEPRIAVAPATVLEWLHQAGVRPTAEGSGPSALSAALAAASRCVVPPGGQGSRLRRRRKAYRHGVAIEGERPAETSDPRAVAAAWRSCLGRLVETGGARAGGQVSVLLFLDLVQDLDLALPLVDQIAARPDATLRVVVSDWLEERSPRVSAELEARGLLPEIISRRDIVDGAGPALAGVQAVVSVVETSEPAHARAHALFKRARERNIPTFSLQHGVENVGLTYEEGGASAPSMLSDHLFTWFDHTRTPTTTPASLRPRLVPVGRPTQEAKTTDLRGVFAGFAKLYAVFENLHWSRYDDTFRRRFLEDCAEFALASPDAAVLLKPHHAGMWAAKNRSSFPQWSSNLVMADPSDPFWEPFTAPSLIAAADLVITTPSTVALDAALARKPVAVAAYGLDLPAFAPLPLLQTGPDWITFAAQAQTAGAARRRAEFVSRTTRPGVAETAAVSYMVEVARARAAGAQRK